MSRQIKKKQDSAFDLYMKKNTQDAIRVPIIPGIVCDIINSKLNVDLEIRIKPRMTTMQKIIRSADLSGLFSGMCFVVKKRKNGRELIYTSFKRNLMSANLNLKRAASILSLEKHDSLKRR